MSIFSTMQHIVLYISLQTFIQLLLKLSLSILCIKQNIKINFLNYLQMVKTKYKW